MKPSEREKKNDRSSPSDICQEFLLGMPMIIQLTPVSMADRKEIIDIFNHYIETSFAAFPDQPFPYESFELILNKCKGFPSVTAKNEQGTVVGFGLLHAYNPFPVFAETVESTYFIKPEWTGKGIGTMMLDYLCQKAKEKGIVTVLASISSLNETSLRFHQNRGFRECGCFRNVGQKNNVRFNIVYMQKFL